MNKKIIPNQLTKHFSDKECEISYQWIKSRNSSKPVVVILHALTGNSTTVGENGWWKELVGNGKTIDTERYDVLSLDTIGNGFYTNTHLSIRPDKLTVQDVAKINLWLLDELNIPAVHSIIGGSLGGAIGWEMWLIQPERFGQIIGIGTHPLEDSWIKGVTYIQKKLLESDENGYENARMLSMLFYRNSLGIHEKFHQASQTIESWLEFHGNALKKRFHKNSYRIMNHLLGAIGKQAVMEDYLRKATTYKGKIVIISISSDWLFHPKHQETMFSQLKEVHDQTSYHSLESTHGHDAFLIEFEKLGKLLQPYYE